MTRSYAFIFADSPPLYRIKLSGRSPGL